MGGCCGERGAYGDHFSPWMTQASGQSAITLGCHGNGAGSSVTLPQVKDDFREGGQKES